MPIDIELLRNNSDLVRQSQKDRFKDTSFVDKAIQYDSEYVKLEYEMAQLRKERNQITQQIKKAKKAKENCDALVARSKEIKPEIDAATEKAKTMRKLRDVELGHIGNIIVGPRAVSGELVYGTEAVPISNDEEKDLVVVRPLPDKVDGHTLTWAPEGGLRTREKEPGLLSHHDLLWRIGGYEPERGVDTAGHRAYYLTGPGVMLNQALIQYGLQFLTVNLPEDKRYKPVQPPYFMNKEAMSRVAQLEEYDEALYHVTGESEDGSKYLIATSEQPICNFHANEDISPKVLPIRYVGFSTCFRKEAGSHGKDTWGIFRVHQFDKVEQFCLTTPDKSWDMQKEMCDLSEKFYQSLGLAYQVVNIVSGELNNAAAKKYDLEAWFPGYDKFRELVSCSNCTDYQARAVGTKLGAKKMGGKGGKKSAKREYVHMLNSTLVACTRTLCCILENYQGEREVPIPEKKDKDGNVVREAGTAKQQGVHVPEVLRKFVGTDFFPFVRKARKVAKPKVSSKKKNKNKSSKNKASPTKKPAKSAAAGKYSAAQLDELLATKSYIKGFVPSKIDAETFEALEKSDTKVDGVNVTRWMNHMRSFDASERASWK